MNRLLFLLAGLLGAAAVGLGAHGAHGLRPALIAQGLEPEVMAKRLQDHEIAVRYHLVHAVGLLGLAVAPPTLARRTRAVAGGLFVLGLALFSGVLYAQSMAGLTGYGLVVMFGGLSFMAGWLTIATIAFHKKDPT